MHGSCHCGAVRIEVARAPEWVSECNCSICRRTGGLFAYYSPAEVTVTGPTVPYLWGDRCLALRHCPTCGNTTHWDNLMPDPQKMGVNARLLEGFWGLAIERRPIDGASF